jgi:tetratricopeptide (TPR) repeat protein
MHAALGALHRWVGNYDASRIHLLRALAIQPNQSQALYELLLWYRDRGDFEKIFEVQRSISASSMQALDIYKVVSQLVLAELYLREGNHDNAQETIRNGLEHLPDNDKLWGALGVIYLDQKDAEQAEQCFLRAQEIRNALPNLFTRNNYLFIEAVAAKHKIPLIAVQYPVRSIEDVKKQFLNPNNVTFVSNEESFKKAIKQDGYFTYFNDMFGGDFGHCSSKGNALIAKAVSEAIRDHIA